MAEFRLELPQGYGEITVNGLFPSTFYEEGTLLSIVLTPLPGITDMEWYDEGNLLHTGFSFAYNMYSRDTRLSGVPMGQYTPINTYGRRFHREYLDVDGRDILWECYKFGYAGVDDEVFIKDVHYNFGESSENPESILKTIVRGSLDFTIGAEYDQFLEFLQGDIRTFRIILTVDSVVKFQGYLTVDYIEVPNLAGNIEQSFTAVDGLQQLASFRSRKQLFPNGTVGLDNIAVYDLIGMLNQSFTERRAVNIATEGILEDRMLDTMTVFEQFYTPKAAILTDGEDRQYVDGNRIFNEALPSNEGLDNLLKPFLCRTFMWENEFWIVRVPTMANESFTVRKFDGNGVFDSEFTITNDVELDCDFDRPLLRTGRVFTEFTVTLETGVLALAAKGGVFDYAFDQDDFYKKAANPYGGIWVLKDWQLVRSYPTNQPDDYPGGENASVQFASDAHGQNLKIWTSTTTSGLSDPNISYIKLITTESAQGYLVADELANKLSIEFDFFVEAVRSEPLNVFSSHSIGFMVKIGDYYLYEVSPNIYDFDTVENVVTIQVPNQYSWNIVKIQNLTVPTTANVEVRIYQLILSAGNRNQFAVRFRNFKLSIEENEAILLSEISGKSKTDLQFSSVFPEFKIKIGDTGTNMSTSAIKLIGTDYYDVSEAWTTNQTDSEPLIGVLLQDLPDLFGRAYNLLSGTLQKVEIKPYSAVIYENKYWLIINFVWDVWRNNYRFKAFELGEIETT